MTQRTKEEEFTILQASLAAAKRGDMEEERRLIRMLPLAPHLAKVAKEMWGKEYLLTRGYDLSEAEAAYGIGWLDR